MVFQFHLIKEFLQTLLKTEFLNYEKYDPSGRNSGNSLNGYYTRSLKTKYGNIQDLKVPRDRNSEFKTVLFESYQRCDN
nr:transposase [Anoxybacter fermentans]